jgi:hypothetical protein
MSHMIILILEFWRELNSCVLEVINSICESIQFASHQFHLPVINSICQSSIPFASHQFHLPVINSIASHQFNLPVINSIFEASIQLSFRLYAYFSNGWKEGWKKKNPIDQPYYGKQMINLDKIKIWILAIWTCWFVRNGSQTHFTTKCDNMHGIHASGIKWKQKSSVHNIFSFHFISFQRHEIHACCHN